LDCSSPLELYLSKPAGANVNMNCHRTRPISVIVPQQSGNASFPRDFPKWAGGIRRFECGNKKNNQRKAGWFQKNRRL
jgi:hypothetical protein